MKKAWLQCMMLAGMLLLSACQKEENQKVTPALVQETQVSAQEFTQGKTGSGVWKVEKDGVSYLPSLLAILAVCNVKRGCTNYLCSNLASVQEAPDNDAAVGAGKFILYIDEEGAVRIGQGINSMTTTDGLTRTEDMQFIETVEAMDMMRDDITAVFRETYLGNYRNSRDNQMLFIASLNSSYFRQLAQENILDPDYANAASIDVEAQRAAWVASDKAEAADWDDDTVKATPYKRTVYLAGNVKILGSMTDLIFPINLF